MQKRNKEPFGAKRLLSDKQVVPKDERLFSNVARPARVALNQNMPVDQNRNMQQFPLLMPPMGFFFPSPAFSPLHEPANLEPPAKRSRVDEETNAMMENIELKERIKVLENENGTLREDIDMRKREWQDTTNEQARNLKRVISQRNNTIRSLNERLNRAERMRMNFEVCQHQLNQANEKCDDQAVTIETLQSELTRANEASDRQQEWIAKFRSAMLAHQFGNAQVVQPPANVQEENLEDDDEVIFLCEVPSTPAKTVSAQQVNGVDVVPQTSEDHPEQTAQNTASSTEANSNVGQVPLVKENVQEADDVCLTSSSASNDLSQMPPSDASDQEVIERCVAELLDAASANLEKQ